jgi:N-acetylmuramoyl-L-alanine amidase
MGATVGYDNGSISVSMNGISIGMSIGSSVAEINGTQKTIPDGIVPKLIAKQGESAKTMVPVRFISETIGMNVDFDGTAGVISISKPAAKLNSVSYSITDSNNIEVTASLSGGVNNINYFTLSDPQRVVVDISNTALNTPSSTIKVNSAGVSSIRLGETSGTSRIVVDVSSLAGYTVTSADNTVTIKVTTTAAAATSASTATAAPAATPAPTAKPAPTLAPDITPAAEGEKIIVIDSGHGGKDGGASGTLNGTTIYEKDLTLSIAKKVESIVSAAGYRVVMTRSGDTYPELTERSDIANSLNAAMFVSIHINSADSSSASGTEVYYAVGNNSDTYGAKSEQLAENILDSMLAKMGTRDRGVKTANHVVTRTSKMPAVLVEVGFISNASDLAQMCDDSFQQLVAEGIAEGMLKTITNITVPAASN